MRCQAAAAQNKNKAKSPARANYWDHMNEALADIPDDGEQEFTDFDESQPRWEQLQQKIQEMTRKQKFLEGRWGRAMPERATVIKTAWQRTLKDLLEHRLAAEKELAEALNVKDDITQSLQSVDEILIRLEQFGTMEEQRTHLLDDADGGKVDMLIEKLATFQASVDERYRILLADERRELEKSFGRRATYSGSELEKLVSEIRGCSPNFLKSMEDNPELAKTVEANPDLKESRTYVLNPLPGPRAQQVIEELQLRYATSKLQRILLRSDEGDREAKKFLQEALDIFTPRFYDIGDHLWTVFRREFDFRRRHTTFGNFDSLSRESVDQRDSLISMGGRDRRGSLKSICQQDLDEYESDKEYLQLKASAEAAVQDDAAGLTAETLDTKLIGDHCSNLGNEAASGHVNTTQKDSVFSLEDNISQNMPFVPTTDTAPTSTQEAPMEMPATPLEKSSTESASSKAQVVRFWRTVVNGFCFSGRCC